MNTPDAVQPHYSRDGEDGDHHEEIDGNETKVEILGFGVFGILSRLTQ
jgi:hypothetical protein